jgi:hypothetical protein
MSVREKVRAFASALVVATTLLALSGACSQHEPGDFQGGGRTIPTSVIGPAAGGPVRADASFQDVEIPDVSIPSDAIELPDTIGPD